MISKIIINNNKIFRYIISGGIAAFSNLATLYILVELLHLWYLISAVISFSAGIIVSYLMQKFFTFKEKSKKNISSQFFIFLIFNLAMLGFNALLMYISVDLLNIQYFFSQIVITGGTAFLNYFVFNKIIFKNNVKAF